MANLHYAFLELNESIRLHASRKDSLRTSRDAIRDKIRKYFAGRSLGLKPKFHGQGSFMMNTIIEPISKEFDIDDGIYFISKDAPTNTIQTFHDWIVDALRGHTKEDPVDKSTCVRLIYKANYHVDLPVYYVQEGAKPKLAHKAKGWIESDPREFMSWFSDKCDERGQLRRIVRYLKVWSDFRKGELPAGIIMSILAADNFVSNPRDDIALCLTLARIMETLDKSFTCLRPTTPIGEDLLAPFGKTKREYFLSSLRSLVEAASFATSDSASHKDACKQWQSCFGADRFPFEDEEIAEERFRMDLQFSIDIDCIVRQNGFRDKLLSLILRDHSWLLPERELEFHIRTPPPLSNYEVYWKVRNVGSEAIKRKQVRGQILPDEGRGSRRERSCFQGKHYVECYIVQQDVCVARAGIWVPISNKPN
jgi:hypothetical protein